MNVQTQALRLGQQLVLYSLGAALRKHNIKKTASAWARHRAKKNTELAISEAAGWNSACRLSGETYRIHNQFDLGTDSLIGCCTKKRFGLRKERFSIFIVNRAIFPVTRCPELLYPLLALLR